MNPVQFAATGQQRDFREYILPVSAGVIAAMGVFTNYYGPLAVFLPVITVLMILDRLGKGIVLRELIALYGMFTCLIMPLIGYSFYTRDNYLARHWGRYMPIADDVYFSFALPAMAAFTMAICWPITNEKYSDYGAKLREIMERVKGQLKENPRVGIMLMVTGIVAQSAAIVIPGLGFVVTLVYFGAFAGALYLYYTPNYKRKIVVLLGFAAFILGLALQNGMFTIVAYMGITMFSFFYLGNVYPLWKKLLFFFVACALLLVLQATKQRYRQLIWHQAAVVENKAATFSSIFVDQIGNLSGFFEVEAFFPFYYRTNQGYNIALVMQNFPARKSFDNGANLATSFASAFVPRSLWPDKPQAGGKYNMLYYTGIQLRQGWSTNVGPLGEAYGSFGVDGGILYMLGLGFFIRWVYSIMFRKSQKMPLIVFWIPVMFYEVTYSAETDSLQIFNSVIKAGFFLYLLWKVKPDWLLILKKIKPRTLRVKRPEASAANT